MNHKYVVTQFTFTILYTKYRLDQIDTACECLDFLLSWLSSHICHICTVCIRTCIVRHGLILGAECFQCNRRTAATLTVINQSSVFPSCECPMFPGICNASYTWDT
ncbi:hypothetical protein BpHYR1_011754 [Brachionus plicatilis]|uniref:Uncharacterized protein n=1 Tax=Brachionus plicatilis TaxID=10195 RepID=A0A3M7P8H2_BRAPC|nr:hypothetical protein BpHYR1_011754 [Brachionus plicatilis]